MRLVGRSVANSRLAAFPFPQLASFLSAYVLQMPFLGSDSEQTAPTSSEGSAASRAASHSAAWNSLRGTSPGQGSQEESTTPDRTPGSITLPVPPMGANQGQDATVVVQTGQNQGQGSDSKPPIGPNRQNTAA